MSDASRVREIFNGAIERSGEARSAFLDGACGGDAALRAKVEALINASEKTDEFLSAPTADVGPNSADHLRTAGAPTARTGGMSIAEQAGARIGPYKLLQLIGEGGFGSVFLSEQERPVRRKVALKIIKLGMDTSQVVARFEQERQALAMMDHPNIARVYDAGATETGRPYFVMELVKGDPIVAYCDKHNLNVHDRLALFAQVCRAVQHAHTKGVIHRDIKPSNILVTTQDGEPAAKVIDFGIAKATSARLTEATLFTEHRQLIGTPEYMSPEQAEGSLDIDTRTDVYSLGVLLYELLTGSTPFSGRELRSAAYAEIQRIIREVDPPRPSTRLSQSGETLAAVAAQRNTEPRRLGTIVRGELDWIVMKALEKDRRRRYESANSLAGDVERFLAGEAVEAAPPSRVYQLRKFVGRNRVLVNTGVAVAAALLTGLVAFAWQARIANQQRERAEAAQRSEQQRAQGEQAARQEAERRLGQIQKSNQILSSIFKSLDPREIAESGRPLQAVLAEHLDSAANELAGEAVGAPLEVADIQLDLGTSLGALGETSKAVAIIEKACTTLSTKLGPQHPETLTAQNELAMAYFDAGDMDKAKAMMEQTLAARRVLKGGEQRETVTCMNNMAIIHNKLGNTAEALGLFSEALELRRTLDGPQHPETANAMHNLALAQYTAGDSAKALPLVQEALAIRKATLGEDHPYTILSAKLAAQCALKLGRRDEAIALMTDVLARARNTLGTEHRTTIELATTLSQCYYEAGQIEPLKKVLEEMLPSMKLKLGVDHPDTLSAMGNLAAACWLSGHLDRSIPLFEETVKGLEKKFGRSDPRTIQAVANLGVNYASDKRFEDATPLLEEVMEACATHPELQFVLPSLLDCYTGTGRTKRATAILKDVTAYTRSATPPDTAARAGALTRLAESLTRGGAWMQAERLFREALTIREKTTPDDWTTANTRSMLGGALQRQSKNAEAEPLLLRGAQELLDKAEAMPSKHRTRVADALERVVVYYDAIGNQAEAGAWRDKLNREKAGPDGGGSDPSTR